MDKRGGARRAEAQWYHVRCYTLGGGENDTRGGECPPPPRPPLNTALHTHLVSLQINLVVLVPRHTHSHELGTKVAGAAEVAWTRIKVLEISGQDALLSTHDICGTLQSAKNTYVRTCVTMAELEIRIPLGSWSFWVGLASSLLSFRKNGQKMAISSSQIRSCFIPNLVCLILND